MLSDRAAFVAHCPLQPPGGSSEEFKGPYVKIMKDNIDLIKRSLLAASLGAALPVHAAETGIATYYTNPHHSGMIAAHKSLPFGARVKVTNVDNGRTAVVVIVDRGPYARGRIIDVSTFAARILGFLQAGVCHARLERL